MKKILIILVVFSLIYCKAKKKTHYPKNISGNGSTFEESKNPFLQDPQLLIAQKRWAGTSSEELEEGKTIYYTKCASCHSPKKITKYSEDQWKETINVMAPRAKLSVEEKINLTKYILSYRETYQK